MVAPKRVAILVADGFVHEDVTAMRNALARFGHTVELVADKKGTVRSWKGEIWGEEFFVDRTTDAVSSDDYDALVVSDGILSVDRLRLDGNAVSFVREFFEADKPVAAIGHAPQLFVDAQTLEGQLLTAHPSIEFDLTNSGAVWQNAPIVKYGNLITAQDEQGLEELLVRLVELLAYNSSAIAGAAVSASA